MEPAVESNVSGATGIGLQVAAAVAGALVGAAAWYLLSVPQDLVNVIFSVLVGVGAGLGAGRFSTVPRSATGVVIAVLIGGVVLLIAQAVITKSYLTWATDNLAGAPANPGWDGPLGSVRLALDRAAGRNGWTANSSYFWWFVSLASAALLGWYSAKRAPSRAA